MAEIIGMPKMNLTMEEGFLAKWHKAVGETVEVDEPLCSIENAKETEDMLSMVAGTLLKRIGEEGSEYPVAAPIAIIGYPGEDISALLARIGSKPGVPDSTGQSGHPDQSSQPNRSGQPDQSSQPNQSGQPDQSSQPDQPGTPDASGHAPLEGRQAAADNEPEMPLKMMPKVRNLVRDLGIDPAVLAAFCAGRRITEDEVLAFQKSRAAAVMSVEAAVGDRREKMSAMRKSIAKNMAESCGRTARLTNFTEVDMTDTFRRLKAMKDEGKKLSITAVLVKACALALREFEIVNTSLDEATDEIIFRGEVNISCAVDVPGGLVVPVVRQADTKNLLVISQEIADFSAKAQVGKLTNQEMKNGTFTVSNVGMLDVDFFTPIIHYPQTAILGAGTVRTLPRYVDEAFETLAPRKVMMLSLTYDHRVIDGAPASRFLKRVKALLQDFPVLT